MRLQVTGQHPVVEEQQTVEPIVTAIYTSAHLGHLSDLIGRSSEVLQAFHASENAVSVHHRGPRSPELSEVPRSAAPGFPDGRRNERGRQGPRVAPISIGSLQETISARVYDGAGTVIGRLRRRYEQLIRPYRPSQPPDYFSDDVIRRSLELVQPKDEELLWFLRTEAALRLRDTTLPDVLKRKAVAWLRQNRKDIDEKTKHLMIANAVNNALLDNKIDRDFRTVIRNQEAVQIKALNLYINGAILPPRGFVNKALSWIGMTGLANRLWLAKAEQILPRKL